MSVVYTGVDTVDLLYGRDLTGNLIPHEWYSKIVTDAGRPNLPAITILSEIVYWYRPIIEQSSENSEEIVLSKKFKADMLQLSYGSLEEKFNLTKDQCRRAMDQLERMGVIKRHFRTVEISSGRRMNNVMYIELFAEKLMEMEGIFINELDPIGINPNRLCDESYEIVGKIRRSDGKNHMTNTYNTTKITNKDYLSIYQEEVESVREQVEYEFLIEKSKSDKGMIDEIINLIAETNLSSKEHHKINGEHIPTLRVKERLERIDIDVMQAVLDSIKSVRSKVSNTRAYMLTALYNAPATYQTDLDMRVRHDMLVKTGGV